MAASDSSGTRQEDVDPITERSPWRSEDVWAIWLGWAVLLAALGATFLTSRAGVDEYPIANPLASWLSDLGAWESNPLDAFRSKSGESVLRGVVGVFAAVLLIFSIGLTGMGERVRGFPLAVVA